jgi:peptidoglycan/LPS O-acetylase OafA/YrhL
MSTIIQSNINSEHINPQKLKIVETLRIPTIINLKSASMDSHDNTHPSNQSIAEYTESLAKIRLKPVLSEIKPLNSKPTIINLSSNSKIYAKIESEILPKIKLQNIEPTIFKQLEPKTAPIEKEELQKRISNEHLQSKSTKHQPQPQGPRKFRPDIEGLRAIAVLCVVIAHSKIGLESGFIGVDVFFVISGFLITGHLYKEALKHGTIHMLQFYSRRILRILPASIFVILATLLAAYLYLSPLQLANYGLDGLFSSLSGMNYRLAQSGTDYFNTATLPSPFVHYWSLAIEEQFYFIWPFIILILTKLFGKSKHFKSILTFILLGIIGASLYYSHITTQVSQTWAYFGLLTRAWELGIGAILAINMNLFARIPSRVSAFLSWIGLGGLITGLIVINESTTYPGVWALIPTLSTALIIAVGTNYNKYSVETIFKHGIFQWIGKISYSWYLVHWAFFVIFLFDAERTGFGEKFGAIIMTFWLAHISYFLVELTTRYNELLKKSMRRVYAMGLSLILVAASISGALLYTNSQKFEAKAFKLAGEESGIIEKVRESTRITTLPDELVIPAGKVPTDKFTDCMTTKESLIPVKEEICVLGDLNSTKRIVLIGDSHANQFMQPIDVIAKKLGYQLVSYTKPGCPFQEVKLNYGDGKIEYTECYSWRNQALTEIEKLSPEVIIPVQIDYPTSTPEIWKNYLAKLKTISKKVINISDSPNPSVNVPQCLIDNKSNIQVCNITKEKDPIRNRKLENEIKMLSDLEVDKIDSNNWFCFEQTCPAIIDNIVVYHDNSHVSSSYAKYLTNLMEIKISSIIQN